MKNIAVILAAGNGSRFGTEKPKQFIRLGGKKVIEYALECFQGCEEIDEICVVVGEDYFNEVKLYARYFSKLKKFLYGGQSRLESSRQAVLEYSKSETDANIIFHDAVRPFISPEIVSETVAALQKWRCVDVAISSDDTLIAVNENGVIDSIPDRSKYRRGQTPQGFRIEVIREAHEAAIEKNVNNFTDDCGLVSHFLPREKIAVIEGERVNIKITHKEDLLLAERILQIRKSNIKFAHENDFSNKTAVVFGAYGGIGSQLVRILRQNSAKVHEISRDCDIRDYKQVVSALDGIDGDIDFVINAVGRLVVQQLCQQEVSDVDEVIDVNFKGAVNIALASFPYLKKSKGMLLLFSSSSYTRGRAGYGVYSASKAAVVNLMQSLDEEWSSDGIRVNCINPTRTNTEMRTKNFGNECHSTLLDASVVAKESVAVLNQNISGQIIDIVKGL